jgi:sugar O-acyltransferase (sialic acid O-acetyltransferase NeuD family)
MVVVGAGGHAIEVIDILSKQISLSDIVLFDNSGNPTQLSSLYTVLKSWDELASYFLTDRAFALATGSPRSRKALAAECRRLGGVMQSIVADTASIGDYNVVLGNGLNVMHRVVITGDVWVGEGTLINAGATVHHNVRIGAFCEISPGVHLLGGCSIGDECRIGAGAVVLPNVAVADGATVGAGAVVTQNVSANETVVGVPAKPIGAK